MLQLLPKATATGFYVSDVGHVGVNAVCSLVCWLSFVMSCRDTPEIHGSVDKLSKALAASDEKYCVDVVKDAS